MNASSFFSKEQQAEILASVIAAEEATSGEIRVHIETSCNKDDIMDHAAWIFKTLGMHKTALRNGVLFYLAVEDKKFAILGDAGINAVVPAGFWDKISEIMRSNFKEGRFSEGLSEGIRLAGEQLKAHFKHMGTDDLNELTDTISFGKLNENDNK